MRRITSTTVAVAIILLSASACGGDDDAPDRDTSSGFWTEGAADDDTEADEVPEADDEDFDPEDLAPIITGTPTELVWGIPDSVPSSWKQTETEPGDFQWKVSQHCALTLRQPAGLGSDPHPTSEQVLDDYIGRLSEVFDVPLQVSDRGSVMMPLVTDRTDVTAFTAVARAHMSGEGGIAGEIRAYRSGDFALLLFAICEEGEFAEVGSQFQPFIEDLTILAEY